MSDHTERTEQGHTIAVLCPWCVAGMHRGCADYCECACKR